MEKFPQLPDSLLQQLPPSLLEMERLCQSPERWRTVSPDELERLLYHATFMYGLAPTHDRVGPLQDLMAVCNDRLSPDVRLRTVSRLIEHLESARQGSDVPEGAPAFFPFMFSDDDEQVASTAALNAAVWLGSEDDREYGRRTVFSFATETADPWRRATILKGLVALSDPITLSWVRQIWLTLDERGRSRVCAAAASQPTKAAAEFLVGLAEDAMSAGEDEAIGAPVGALGRLAGVAKGEVQGNPYAGRGVYELRRIFPAWAAEDGAVVQVLNTWTPQEFGRIIMPRLQALAANEQEPKILPDIISMWS